MNKDIYIYSPASLLSSILGPVLSNVKLSSVFVILLSMLSACILQSNQNIYEGWEKFHKAKILKILFKVNTYTIL